MQTHKKNTYQILGIMSGSSLDGVDLAYCTFNKQLNNWAYQIIKAETIPYDLQWIDSLISAMNMSGKDLFELHTKYGRYLGEIAHKFLKKNKLEVDFIASHGHTVFHEPVNGFTFQLGEGQALAQVSNQKVICDFRSKDISLGGQGAPLVPIGDDFLFSDYANCINIGGIANISYRKSSKRIAFDICPANQMLNHLSKQLGKSYDADGKIASSGVINDELLTKLNADKFYNLNPPKSLNNQYVKYNFISHIDQCNEKVENKLRTVTEHIAIQLSKAIEDANPGKVLITGGGAYNLTLIQRVRSFITNEIIVPEDNIVDFKEALIFAFMGLLRSRNEINCLASVTGAMRDSSGGVFFYP